MYPFNNQVHNKYMLTGIIKYCLSQNQNSEIKRSLENHLFQKITNLMEVNSLQIIF